MVKACFGDPLNWKLIFAILLLLSACSESGMHSASSSPKKSEKRHAEIPNDENSAGQKATTDISVNTQDFAYIAATLSEAGNCTLDVDEFKNIFTTAMARFERINPSAAATARNTFYKTQVKLVCNLTKDESAYFDGEKTIHMWSVTTSHLKHVAIFFHEFLHFLKFPIDRERHNSTGYGSLGKTISQDSVYACHLSVFPELLKSIKESVSEEEKKQALDLCASIKI